MFADFKTMTKLPKNESKITKIIQVLRMGFAVVVAAIVVEPERFGRGKLCLHSLKACVKK